MNQAVDAAEVHKCTEVHDGGNSALETHAALELGENLGTLGLAGLLEHHAAGENDVVTKIGSRSIESARQSTRRRAGRR